MTVWSSPNSHLNHRTNQGLLGRFEDCLWLYFPSEWVLCWFTLLFPLLIHPSLFLTQVSRFEEETFLRSSKTVLGVPRTFYRLLSQSPNVTSPSPVHRISFDLGGVVSVDRVPPSDSVSSRRHRESFPEGRISFMKTCSYTHIKGGIHRDT